MVDDSCKLNHIRHFGAEEQPDGRWLHNDGDVYWYNEAGDVHREDGPAIIRHALHPDFLAPCWRFNGATYSFDDWFKVTTASDEQKLLLRLQYG
jgi:hypothetical protein